MNRYLWAAPILLVLLAYSDAPRNGFVGDDHIYIESNTFVHHPENLRLLLDPRFYLHAQELLAGHRPLFVASLVADWAVWKGRAFGFHLTNIVLHAANAAWVLVLAGTLGLSPPAALAAAIAFGLHPALTEAVDGISNRPDLLSTFFVFLSLWLYLMARRRPGRRAVPWILGGAASFGLALLSKEMALTLPLLVLLVEAFFPIAENRRLRLGMALPALLLVAAAWAGFWTERFSYQGLESSSRLGSTLQQFASSVPTVPGPTTDAVHEALPKAHLFPSSNWEWGGVYADRSAWLLTSARTLAGYVEMMILPLHLVAERAPVVVRGFTETGGWLALLALFALAAYAALMRRCEPVSAFGCAWILATMLPVSNLIPLYNPAAERYLYLPTTGAALAAGAAFAIAAARRRKAAIVVAALVALLFGAQTWRRNLDWQDERTLFHKAPASTPQNSRVRLIRAGLLLQDGRLDAAIGEYDKVLAERPDFAEAWLGLASVYGATGQTSKAEQAYDRALRLAPKNASMRFAYALLLTRTGQLSRAADLYHEALRLEPRFVEAWVNLGALYRDQGKFLESKECYERAVALAAPHDPVPFYSYGVMLERMKESQRAQAQYQAALDRDPTFQPARQRLDALRQPAKSAR